MVTVRGHSSSGDVVETFATQAEAHDTVRRLRARGMPVATLDPAPPGTAAPSACSFCGKGRAQVGGLVAGPSGSGVAICDQCVALCGELLAEQTGGAPRA